MFTGHSDSTSSIFIVIKLNTIIAIVIMTIPRQLKGHAHEMPQPGVKVK